jgi:Flp pilus assembly protein TadD
MNHKSSLIVSTVLLLSTVCLGCNTFRKKSDQDLLNQLNFSSGKPRSLWSGKQPSERELCVETARTVAQKGHAAEAIGLYEKAERLDSKSKPLDLELAPLYMQVGKTESAIKRYRSEISRGQADEEAYNNLAWALMESGNYQDAIQTVQQGLAESPENRRLHSTHAVILHKQGNSEQSFQVFQKLYGESAAYHNLAILELENDQSEKALEHLNLAVAKVDCSPQTVALKNAIEAELQLTAR